MASVSSLTTSRASRSKNSPLLCCRGAVGLRRRRRRGRSGRCRWNSSVRLPPSLPSASTTNRAGLAVGPARHAALASSLRAGRRGPPPRRSRRPGRKSAAVTVSSALPANDVAVGDPQRLAALEAPQRRHHGRVVVRPARRPRPHSSSTSASRATGCPSVIRSRS